MKKLSYLLILLFSLTLISGSLYAQTKEKTIKGEVVDLLTYASTGKSGATFKETMMESAKKGNPLGILSGGKLYLVISNNPDVKPNDQLMPFLCMKVVAKGMLYNKGGLNILILSNIDKDMKANQ